MLSNTSLLRSLPMAALATAIGASSAHAAPVTYQADLSGANEAVPNASPASGVARVTIDSVAHTMRVRVSFADLLDPNTAAHIHATTTNPFAGTAAVATQVPTFTGFPLGTTSGTYDRTFDMTDSLSYNPAFITANGGTPGSAEAALFSAIGQSKAYLNIHSQLFPGGEIRGFFTAVVPLPSAALMSVAGLGVVATARRRRA